MMLIPAVAIIATVGIPGAFLSSLLLTQDGRMDKFLAAPRITLPAEMISEPPATVPQSSGGSSATSAKASTMVAAAPSQNSERKISINVYSEHASDLIAQLQSQNIHLIINLATFPDAGVVISIDDRPESFVMTTLGEALGGSFLNRGGVWIWSKQPTPPAFGGGFGGGALGGGGFGGGMGGAMTSAAPAMTEMVKVEEFPAKAAIDFGYPRPPKPEHHVRIVETGFVMIKNPGFKISPEQQKTVKRVGYLKYYDLSKYQRSQIGEIKPGPTVIINGVSIRF